MIYIGFRKRFLAYLIDMLILFIPNIFYLIANCPSICLVITISYFAIFEASPLQATLGKLILKIKVVDENGYRLNVFKAFLRNILKVVVSNFLFMFGFIMVIFTKRKQGYHDMLLKTIVVSQNYGLAEDNLLNYDNSNLIRKFISFQLIIIPIFSIMSSLVIIIFKVGINSKNIITLISLIFIGILASIGFYNKKKWAFWLTSIAISYSFISVIYSVVNLMSEFKVKPLVVLPYSLFFTASIFILFRDDLIKSFQFEIKSIKKIKLIIFLIILITIIFYYFINNA